MKKRSETKNKISDATTRIIQLRCPACGAQLDLDEELDVMFCKYCGEKILIDNEARLSAKVELKKHQDQIDLKKYKIEKEAQEEKTGIKVTFAMIGILFFISAALFGWLISDSNKADKEMKAIEQQVEDYYAAGDYDMALFKANQLVFAGSDNNKKDSWDQKREAWTELIEQAIEKEK